MDATVVKLSEQEVLKCKYENEVNKNHLAISEIRILLRPGKTQLAKAGPGELVDPRLARDLFRTGKLTEYEFKVKSSDNVWYLPQDLSSSNSLWKLLPQGKYYRAPYQNWSEYSQGTQRLTYLCGGMYRLDKNKHLYFYKEGYLKDFFGSPSKPLMDALQKYSTDDIELKHIAYIFNMVHIVERNIDGTPMCVGDQHHPPYGTQRNLPKINGDNVFRHKGGLFIPVDPGEHETPLDLYALYQLHPGFYAKEDGSKLMVVEIIGEYGKHYYVEPCLYRPDFREVNKGYVIRHIQQNMPWFRIPGGYILRADIKNSGKLKEIEEFSDEQRAILRGVPFRPHN